MTTEDWVLLIYISGCVLFVIACFVSAARGNWQGDDNGALGILVCWMWPLMIFFIPFDMWEQHRLKCEHGVPPRKRCKECPYG